MKISKDPISLTSPEFHEILTAVDFFHDGTLGCACFDFHGPMAFIDTMWFGPELGYNPKPIIGGIFWFDLNDLKEVHEFDSYYDREINRINVDKEKSSITIEILDRFETLAFTFGPNANFQFIMSTALGSATLERR